MEQTNLKIRKTSEKDITFLYELINELASYEKRPNDMTASIEDLECMLFKRHMATAVIAENNEGNPLGYAIYYPIFSSFSGKAKVHIEDLFIKPEYRHQGLGKEFFYQLSNLIKDEEYIEMEWSCLDWNTSSIEFYKKLNASIETGRVYFGYKL